MKIDPDIREFLEDKEKFKALSEFFISKLEDELDEKIHKEDSPSLVINSLQLLLGQHIKVVSQFSESPIEKIFLNALMISFIRNAYPLIVMPPLKDTEKGILDFLEQLNKLDEFLNWFDEKYSNRITINEYLNGEVENGKMPFEEKMEIERLILFYNWLTFRRVVHLTVQPGFPKFIDDKSIRADMYFWVPDFESYKIIVECDGYKYHADANSFTLDRQRDRVFKSMGYDVFRYSGSEIYNNPVESAHNLFSFLIEKLDDENTKMAQN